MTSSDWLFWLAFIFGAVSMFLLFKEQRKGIKVEAIQHELDDVARIVSTVKDGEWRKALAETLFVERHNPNFKHYWSGHIPEDDVATIARARQIAQTFEPDTCRTILEGYGVVELMQGRADQILDQWHRHTMPQKHAERRRLTYLGTALGALAFLLSGINDRVDKPTTEIEQITVTKSLFPTLVEPILMFGPGQTALAEQSADSRDLQGDVCTLKKNLADQGVSAVMVLAHHDHRPPNPTLFRRFTSNAGIAQARAEAVATSLRLNDACGKGLTVTMTLMGGPTINEATVRSDAATQIDRSVSVYGLK